MAVLGSDGWWCGKVKWKKQDDGVRIKCEDELNELEKEYSYSSDFWYSLGSQVLSDASSRNVAKNKAIWSKSFPGFCQQTCELISFKAVFLLGIEARSNICITTHREKSALLWNPNNMSWWCEFQAKADWVSQEGVSGCIPENVLILLLWCHQGFQRNITNINLSSGCKPAIAPERCRKEKSNMESPDEQRDKGGTRVQRAPLDKIQVYFVYRTYCFSSFIHTLVTCKTISYPNAHVQRSYAMSDIYESTLHV